MTSHFIEVPASNKSIANRKPIHGVGINNAPYKITVRVHGKKLFCPYYRVWTNMLNRCYSPKTLQRKPTYRDCIVCSDWLLFSNFKSWMLTQNWQGKELDKDVLDPTNKTYSPETCKFVSRQINSLIVSQESTRGDLPRGVHYSKRDNVFVAQCFVKNAVVHLGSFNNAEEASLAYRTFKYHHVRSIANAQTDNDIAYGLHLHSEAIFNKGIMI